MLGAGAVGSLTALLLRQSGIETWVASLEPEAPLLEAAGAHYAQIGALPELGRFDLVVECAGNAQLMGDSIGLLRRSGVACLLGIDGREQTVSLDGRVLAVDVILENRVVFGSVNAHRQDWIAGVEALARIDRRAPARPDRDAGAARPVRGRVRLPRRQGHIGDRRGLTQCVPSSAPTAMQTQSAVNGMNPLRVTRRRRRRNLLT